MNARQQLRRKIRSGALRRFVVAVVVAMFVTPRAPQAVEVDADAAPPNSPQLNLPSDARETDAERFPEAPRAFAGLGWPTIAAPGCSLSRGCGDYLYELNVEYLAWWIDGNGLPPLVTTNTTVPQPEEAGVLGVASTRILYGNAAVDEDVRHGGRITLKIRSPECCGDSWEAHWLSLGDGNESGDFFAASGGDRVLARPFFNVVTDMEDASVVAFPGSLAGQIAIDTSSEFHSGGALWHRTLFHNPCPTFGSRLDFLLGYRYLRFRESLRIQDERVSTSTGGGVAIGTTFDIVDRFKTTNVIHAGEIGLEWEIHRCRWMVDVTGKLAFGGNQGKVAIDGSTIITAPDDAPSPTDGGLLALPTNGGVHEIDELAIIPELNIRLHYRCTDRLSLYAGYTLIAVRNVFRTGDQIDRAINPTLLPTALGGGGALVGEARPRPLLKSSDLSIQGFSFGGRYAW